MAGPVNPKQGFSYDPPPTDTDGDPFPAGKIAKYQIGLRRTGSVGTYEMVVDDAAFENGKQLSPMTLFGNLAYGQWFGAVRVASTEGPVSDWSSEVPFVLEAAKPSPPANFSVA